jgi:hypothetical protein
VWEKMVNNNLKINEINKIKWKKKMKKKNEKKKMK